MNIYDLDNAYYLVHDLEDILERISQFYSVDFDAKPYKFTSIKAGPKNVNWASNASQEHFNRLVPSIKSIVKDMYAIIESLFTSKYGSYDRVKAEDEYQYLKELRLLNNKLKHFKDKGVAISLIMISLIEEPECRLDFMVQYKIKDQITPLMLSQLMLPFFQILEDFNRITIEKNKNGTY